MNDQHIDLDLVFLSTKICSIQVIDHYKEMFVYFRLMMDTPSRATPSQGDSAARKVGMVYTCGGMY